MKNTKRILAAVMIASLALQGGVLTNGCEGYYSDDVLTDDDTSSIRVIESEEDCKERMIDMAIFVLNNKISVISNLLTNRNIQLEENYKNILVVALYHLKTELKFNLIAVNEKAADATANEVAKMLEPFYDDLYYVRKVLDDMGFYNATV